MRPFRKQHVERRHDEHGHQRNHERRPGTAQLERAGPARTQEPQVQEEELEGRNVILEKRKYACGH